MSSDTQAQAEAFIARHLLTDERRLLAQQAAAIEPQGDTQEHLVAQALDDLEFDEAARLLQTLLGAAPKAN
jgi:hypothetical protein